MSEEKTTAVATDAVAVAGDASGAKAAELPAAPFGEVFGKFLKPLEYFTQVNGRARRGEFWTAALMVLLPCIVLGFIAGSIALSSRSLFVFIILSLPITVLGLFMVPVTIRRWHDLGATGWIAIAAQAVTGFPCSAIPYLGAFLGFAASITCLVFYCLPGKKENNAYGANPCDPAAVDPADSVKEPWQPLIWTSVGLTFVNWIWSVYNTHSAIKAIEGLSALFSF